MAKYLGLRGPALTRAIIWLVVCPAFTCYGYNISVAGGLLTLPSFVKMFPSLDTINTTGSQQSYNSTIQGKPPPPLPLRSFRPSLTLAPPPGTVVALFTVGGIFGSLSCIYLGDRLGRRRVIQLASLVAALGVVLMASAFSLAQFVVARLVLGLGTGGYLATVPVWQAEISRAGKRGAHVVMDGIFVGAGISLALWLDFGFFFVKDSSVAWRFPFAFQILFLAAVGGFVTLLPESPRWLVKRDRVEEAREILAALSDDDPASEAIANEVREIQHSLSVCGALSWKAMTTMGEQRLLHRTVLAATGQMFQQMCGINLISMYATTIFEQYLGMNPTSSRILAASMAMTQILGGYLAFFTIDRLGRRFLMLACAAGMGVAMAILAGTTSAPGNTAALVVAVVCLFAFQFIYTVGYSGLTYLYATEVAPLQLRAAISAVATAAVWTFNFLLAEVTPIGFNTISYRYYIIFAVLNATIIPVVYFFFPETSGRSLEEIDEIFMQSKSIWDPVKVARTLPRMTTEIGVTVTSLEGADEKVEYAK
ncbi:General substrate transporter [Cordyceps fumosorosea ARSEF 2679]|uniref:General substrate transporter n=1 Tax=Cordyceps fumosorosea (strain ARSEF 2679) TaxID=1081104 RepID=A0A168BBU8_CORFA|nr:General substrate transporter [Cordyceps fumosorosea ARSEF 2679]OAA69905.1 General substrate transporter [Cordyceps fumosorosea ARSEF 2679]